MVALLLVGMAAVESADLNRVKVQLHIRIHGIGAGGVIAQPVHHGHCRLIAAQQQRMELFKQRRNVRDMVKLGMGQADNVAVFNGLSGQVRTFTIGDEGIGHHTDTLSADLKAGHRQPFNRNSKMRTHIASSLLFMIILIIA